MTSAADLVRPGVLALSPYNFGLTAAEVSARYAPARISKLSSNGGPFGARPRGGKRGA